MTGGRARGPKFSDAADDERVETRQFFAYDERSEMGRTNVQVDCPFCGSQVTVFVWSLAGGGKRCQCGALFGSGGTAYHWADAGAR